MEKKHFQSSIPHSCKFSNQDYESYKNRYNSDGKLVYFNNFAGMGEDPDMFFEDTLGDGAA